MASAAAKLRAVEKRGGLVQLKALCRECRLKEAFDILTETNHSKLLRVNSDIVVLLLKACADMKLLSEGKQIHAKILKVGIGCNIFMYNKLIIMYTKCASLEDARHVFDKMYERNAVSWSSVIGGYVTQGQYEEALALFYKMREDRGIKADNFVFPPVLKACGGLSALQEGKEVHDYIAASGLERDVFVENSLVEMYATCKSIENAEQVFDKMPERNLVSWNVMISGFAQNGCREKAMRVFREMQVGGMKPNAVTITSVLPACSLQQGKEIHGYILKHDFSSDILVENALLDMYSKCGRIESACQVFNKMSQRDMVSWNSMISCYAQSGRCNEALELFHQMQSAGIKGNIISWTTIIVGYAKHGQGEEALQLFHEMQSAGIEPDIVSWNVVATAFSQNAYGNEAVLRVFRQMQLRGMKPNNVTIASVLPACTNLAALQQGKEIHAYVLRSQIEWDVFVGSAIVDMYAKCGCVRDAWQVFTKMSQRNVVSWNTMIAGCAMHGHGRDAVSLFEQMQEADIKPNSITFTSVLSACSHVGLVDEGWKFFNRMQREYLITPCEEHYACMVDLLGRSGDLVEAHDFISKMPLKPNACVWGALLGACGLHCNIELAEYVAERLFTLEPENVGNYVLLSNAYATAGRWGDVVKGTNYIFKQIEFMKPECLLVQLEEAGYEPDMNSVLHDLD
eukprot:PITA_01269